MAQFEEKEAVKIATMYYVEGMTQAQIARKMGVSRSLISKILLDAKEDGIVEIFIHSKSAYTVQLERQLEEKYDLKNVIVVDTYNLNQYEISKMASQEAALYLQKISKQIDTLGVSWGKSLRGLVDHYPFTNQSNVTVIPLIGGMGEDFVDIHSNQLSYDLAHKMRGTAKYLYAPALVSNSGIKQELQNNQAIRAVLEAGKKVDIALVGLSNPYKPNTMLEIGYINEEDVVGLHESGAVGDVNSRFYNEDGEEVDSKINQHVLGLNLDDLKNIPLVMTIVYEMDKVSALKVAVEQKLVNILVTSDQIAMKLLKD